MNAKGRRPGSKNSPRHLVTTLGDLITAAYDAVPGPSPQRIERALRLLTRSPLARSIHPHVEFVR